MHATSPDCFGAYCMLTFSLLLSYLQQTLLLRIPVPDRYASDVRDFLRERGMEDEGEEEDQAGLADAAAQGVSGEVTAELELAELPAERRESELMSDVTLDEDV